MDGRSLRAQKTKAKLFDAAKSVFQAKGFEQATITQIAKEANIGYGTVYRYFDGKDKLLIGIMEDVMEEFYAVAQMPYHPYSLQDAKRKIERQVKKFLSLANNERKILKVFYEAKGFSQVIEDKWVAIRNQFIARIVTDIEYAQSMQLTKPSINKYIVAKGWFFMNEMFLWDIVTDDAYPYDVQEIADALVALYTTGLYIEENE